MGSFHFEDWAHDQRVTALFLPVQSFLCKGYKPIFFLLHLEGPATILHQNGEWFTRFAWYGSLWEFNRFNRDECFLCIPTTELLAGLPSTSKPNRALPGVGKQHKKQCLVCKKQFYCLT